MTALATPADRGTRLQSFTSNPLTRLTLNRLVVGLLTLVVVSILVFAATEVLPGNAAYAVLGHNASPQEVAALEKQLHLNDGVVSQYWRWASGVLRGHFGTSLASAGTSVWTLVWPRLINTAVLAAVAGLIGVLIGVTLGVYAAARKDGPFDTAFSTVALALAALPEFVIATGFVMLFATVVFRVLPGVSPLPPGTYPWQDPKLLILPAATLVVVVIPYIFRMTRGAMIEALESDYVEMARLKGVSSTRVLVGHAMPNAMAAAIQVVALTLLYLAGGVVIVETAFDYPGIGQALVNAVSSRDIPVIQFIVLCLAAFYIVVNIVADVAVLAVTPRRRFPR